MTNVVILDVHKKVMVVCFLYGREQEIRESGATIRATGIRTVAFTRRMGNGHYRSASSAGSRFIT